MTNAIRKWGASRSWNPDSKRVRLAEAVPLRSPFLGFIDPSSGCNFKCTFCPTGSPELLRQVGRKNNVMKWEVFLKAVEGFAAFPDKLRALHMHKDGEPLMNPRIGDMLAYVVQKDIAEKYWITTNGSLLDEELSARIVESGIDAVRLSIEHVNSNGYADLTKTFDAYDELLQRIGTLRNERDKRGSKMYIVAKLIDFDFTDEEKQKFVDDFNELADDAFITEPHDWNRTGTGEFLLGAAPEAGYDGERPLRPDRIVCPYPFYNLAVNSDGSVGVCPMDWSRGLNVGTLEASTLVELWQSEATRNVQLLHLQGRRHEHPVCGKCHCMQAMPDDSDMDGETDRKNLLARYGMRVDKVD